MRTKKKMSVTIDAELLEAIEDVAKTCNMAKSQLAQEAFRLWFKKGPKNRWPQDILKWPRKTGNRNSINLTRILSKKQD